jgi:hypothetical protein
MGEVVGCFKRCSVDYCCGIVFAKAIHEKKGRAEVIHR